MNRKKVIVLAVIAVIISGFIFKDSLIRTYVTISHESLEQYSEQLLNNKDVRSDRYGLWNVDVYHEDAMVEFMTGGSGLAPSSVYKGFYYSADNSHKVFSVADSSAATLEINGDLATWTDGTDNHGSSTRIVDKWFWFEAAF